MFNEVSIFIYKITVSYCFITDKILSHVGGITAKKNVLLIMKKVMSRELSLQYSDRGKRQKKDFSKLKSYQAVLGSIMTA